jgi:hypothetical protein
MTARRALSILFCTALWLAGRSPAEAQEWHEAYRDGVKALAQGQPARAVGLLEYAVSKRPQPGRDIVTYGTNVERQYYPYLKLAEAYLKQHDLAGARSASSGPRPGRASRRTSAGAWRPRRRRWPRRRPAVAPSAAPTPMPLPPTTLAAELPPVATPAPVVKTETPPPAASRSRAPPAPTRAEPARREPGGPGAGNTPSPRATAAATGPATPAAVLEVVSQPPAPVSTWTTS